MKGFLIATAWWIAAFWLVRRDTARREGISAATWIPTLWAGILLSRPLSLWLGFGGAVDKLEGSPVDRLFYFLLIFFAIIVLARRDVPWGLFISRNWPIFLYYGYLLVSVVWAQDPFVSFKRWFKECGNIFMALLILTERNPREALCAVFSRCAYAFIPLSIIFVRWVPSFGRIYTRAGGLEVTGVTTQKNSLGTMLVVCGLILILDRLEHASRSAHSAPGRFDRLLPVGFLLLAAEILRECDSATSILALVVSGSILLSSRLPVIRRRPGMLTWGVAGGTAFFFIADWLFGIKAAVIKTLGRNETLTGRTDIWQQVFGMHTDPLIGTGFYSFWSDPKYTAKMPDWMGSSAHNGFLETYIDGGILGLVFLSIMLLCMFRRLWITQGTSATFGAFRIACFLALIIGDLTESHFGRLSALFLVNLITMLDLPGSHIGSATAESEFDDEPFEDEDQPVFEHVPFLAVPQA